MVSNEAERVQRDFSDLYVYEQQDSSGDAAPFDVFLECTDEKLVMGAFLGSKLAALPPFNRPLRLLDIGCGDGSLGAQIIQNSSREVEYVGFDPVASSVEKARLVAGRHATRSSVFQSKFENYSFDGKPFDAILASNLYHLATEDVPPFLRGTQSLLAPHGNTFFVYRSTDDDLLTVRRRFEAPLYDDFREPRTISHVIDACTRAELNFASIEEVVSKIEIPPDERRKQKIVEFILNRSVHSFDAAWLNDIYAFIDNKNNSLSSAQAVMTIKSAES